MLRFTSAGRSHPGLVRDNNEDSGFAGPYLQLVADGVGGAAAGEVASATAGYVTCALASLLATRPDAVDLLTVLEESFRVSYEQLRAGTAADPARDGMGTTLTAVLTDGSQCALAHVGDSRAYLFRTGELSQLTHDHTFVQTLVDDGTISKDDAREHPHKNVVMQAVDGDSPADPDLLMLDLRVGDRLLLCSDGLTDLVHDDRILECLRLADRDDVVTALVESALASGGSDNVTCLVADVIDGPRLVPDGTRLGALADPHLVVDPAAVRATTV